MVREHQKTLKQAQMQQEATLHAHTEQLDDKSKLSELLAQLKNQPRLASELKLQTLIEQTQMESQYVRWKGWCSLNYFGNLAKRTSDCRAAVEHADLLEAELGLARTQATALKKGLAAVEEVKLTRSKTGPGRRWLHGLPVTTVDFADRNKNEWK